MSDESVLQQLIGRTKMWLAGVTHHGRRDLYELFGYRRQLGQSDFAARYLRQEIAKRILDAPVLATWADPPDLSADNMEFIDAWKLLLEGDEESNQEPVPVFQSIIRLDKLAGLGAYAVMVFGFDDGRPLSAPVIPNPSRKLLYLQPYAELAVKVDSYERDSSSPRFGKPLLYTITPGRFTPEIRVGSFTSAYASGDRKPFNVHHSRILHVAEGLLEDSVFGRSRFEALTNSFDDLLKVSGGSAEMFWILANRGMQVDIDKEMELDPDAAAELSKEIEEYHNDLRRVIRTRGVAVKELGSHNIDPKSPFDVQINLLAAGTGMPKMIMLGNTSGVTSSQQDRASWAERIMERATEYAEPVVLKPFIYALVNAGVLPRPIKLVINWQEAFKLSPLERSQTSAQMARSAANLTKVISQVDTVGSPAIPAGKDPITGKVTPGQPAKPAQQPLFTVPEMRQIVGPGKRFPVFDKVTTSAQDPAHPKKAPKVASTGTSGAPSLRVVPEK